MSSDMGLHIDVTADAGPAAAELANIEDRLAALEAAYKSTSVAATKTAASTEKVAATSKAAATGLEQMAAHTNTAARGLNALGLEAGGAAARVEGLLGVMEDLQKAIPELLAIGAAFVAFSSTFNFFKDGIAAATQLQFSLQTLRASVDAQGASWDTASAAIERFITQESLASGFTENELAASMNTLVSAGTNVSDAMNILSVAEETAIAHHQSLIQVTNELQQAEAGRGMMLAKLDPKIKVLIQDHATLSQVLQVLHKDNQDQISDSDSLVMAQRREAVAMEQSAEAVGQILIPALTNLNYEVIGGIQVAKDFGAAWVAIAQEVAVAAKVLQDVAHGANALGEDQVLNLAAGRTNAAIAKWANDPEAGVLGRELTAAAVKAHNASAGNTHLLNDPTLGLTRALHGKGAKGAHGGSGLGYNASEVTSAAVDMTALTAAHNAFNSSAASTETALSAIKATIDPTMTSEQANTIAVEKLQAAYNDAKKAIPQLVSDLHAERTAEQESQAAVQAKYAAYVESTKALNDLEKSLQGKSKLTIAEKQELIAAKDAQKQANLEYKNADTALKAVTKSIGEHEKALAADVKAVNAFNAEQQKMIVGLNDVIAKDKERQQQELATYGLSLDAQVRYWTEKLAYDQKASQEYYNQHGAWNAELLKQEENSYTKLLDLQTKAIEQKQANAKKAHDQELAAVDTFLGDLVTKHESFKNAFKSIWDDITKIFIDDIGKMIVESKLFSEIFGNLGGGMGGGGGIAGLVAGMFGGGGGAASVLNGGIGTAGPGLNSLIGMTGTASSTGLNINVAGIAPGASSAAGGGGLLGPLGGASMGLTMGILGGSALIGSGIGALMHDSPGNNNATIGAVMGGGAAALGIGAFGAFAGIGGGLAGALATMGPAGWAVLLGGAVLGGGIGGLIGDHTQPATSPDIYDGKNFGQAMANLEGAGVQSGVESSYGDPSGNFTESSNVSKATGGQGELQYIAAYIAKVGVAAATQTLGASTVAMMQGMPTSGNAFQPGAVHQGNALLANGQQVPWQQLSDAASQAVTAINALGGAASSATTPIYNVTHSFPDWQNANIALGGNYTPGGPTTGSTGGGASTGVGVGGTGWKGSGGSPGHGILPILPTPIHVHLNVGGNVMTEGDLISTITTGVTAALLRGQQMSLQGSI